MPTDTETAIVNSGHDDQHRRSIHQQQESRRPPAIVVHSVLRMLSAADASMSPPTAAEPVTPNCKPGGIVVGLRAPASTTSTTRFEDADVLDRHELAAHLQHDEHRPAVGALELLADHAQVVRPDFPIPSSSASACELVGQSAATPKSASVSGRSSRATTMITWLSPGSAETPRATAARLDAGHSRGQIGQIAVVRDRVPLGATMRSATAKAAQPILPSSQRRVTRFPVAQTWQALIVPARRSRSKAMQCATAGSVCHCWLAQQCGSRCHCWLLGTRSSPAVAGGGTVVNGAPPDQSGEYSTHWHKKEVLTRQVFFSILFGTMPTSPAKFFGSSHPGPCPSFHGSSFRRPPTLDLVPWVRNLELGTLNRRCHPCQ